MDGGFLHGTPATMSASLHTQTGLSNLTIQALNLELTSIDTLY